MGLMQLLDLQAALIAKLDITVLCAQLSKQGAQLAHTVNLKHKNV